MTEPSTTELPEAKPKALIPADVLFALVGEIARQLNEPNRALIRRIVIVTGVDRAQALLQQTLEIEAAGGQMTVDGTRRKTAGGVFITLARRQASSEGRPKMRQFTPQKRLSSQRAAPSPPAAPADSPKPKERKPAPAPPQAVAAPPVPAPTWDEVKQLVKAAMQQIGEAKTVKLTLIGRPSKFVQQPSCVVVAMRGKAPPSLPKGLPTPPAQSAITWAVFIANKQWDKVKDALTASEEDQLILEGYPLLDPKSNASVVLATSCKSVMMESAQWEAKKSSEG